VAGSQVGAHNASVNHPASFTWTQYETVSSTISRSQAMTFNWTGGSPGGIVAITLASLTQATPTGIGAQVVCFADATAGSFTIPASFMSALPPSGTELGVPLGSLAVINLTLGGQVSIPGVDRGYTNAYDTYNVGPITFQ
jgi:hypothetical protein